MEPIVQPEKLPNPEQLKESSKTPWSHYYSSTNYVHCFHYGSVKTYMQEWYSSLEQEFTPSEVKYCIPEGLGERWVKASYGRMRDLEQNLRN
jgi:hypothetical protein